MGPRNELKGVEIHGRAVRISFQWQGQRCREIVPNIQPTPPSMRYAAKLRAEIVQKIRLGNFRYADYFPNSARAGFVQQSARKTFADIADAWLNSKSANVASTSLTALKLQVEWWKIQLGHQPIRDIKYLDIAGALSMKNWKSPKTRNNYLIPVRGVFDVALSDGHIDSNPTVMLKNSHVEKADPDPLTHDEMKTVLAYMQKHYPATVHNYFDFAFSTGLRPSELIELRWKDVDLRANKLSIKRARVGGNIGPTKTRAKWPVNLLPPAIEALSRQRAITGLKGPESTVFENPITTRPWADHQQQRKKWWAPALHACGLHARDAYQCRHTYATLLLMAGIKPAYIASQLGHASAKMVYERYARWIPDAAGDAAEAARATVLFNEMTQSRPKTKTGTR